MNIFIIVIGALAIACLLIYITTYNKFIHLKALLAEAWSGIDVQLKRRYDLIPNLVAVVKQYSVHEKEIFETVAKMRAASMNATGVEQKSAAEVGLTHTLKTLFAIAENYPELKANTNFLSLQKDLADIENDIQLARRYYNGTVRNYNVLVQRFPSNIVASIHTFASAPYFEINSAIEREVPHVKF